MQKPEVRGPDYQEVQAKMNPQRARPSLDSCSWMTLASHSSVALFFVQAYSPEPHASLDCTFTLLPHLYWKLRTEVNTKMEVLLARFCRTPGDLHLDHSVHLFIYPFP